MADPEHKANSQLSSREKVRKCSENMEKKSEKGEPRFHEDESSSRGHKSTRLSHLGERNGRSSAACATAAKVQPSRRGLLRACVIKGSGEDTFSLGGSGTTAVGPGATFSSSLTSSCFGVSNFARTPALSGSVGPFIAKPATYAGRLTSCRTPNLSHLPTAFEPGRSGIPGARGLLTSPQCHSGTVF
jgi:hypothetical protein